MVPIVSQRQLWESVKESNAVHVCGGLHCSQDCNIIGTSDQSVQVSNEASNLHVMEFYIVSNRICTNVVGELGRVLYFYISSKSSIQV